MKGVPPSVDGHPGKETLNRCVSHIQWTQWDPGFYYKKGPLDVVLSLLSRQISTTYLCPAKRSFLVAPRTSLVGGFCCSAILNTTGSGAGKSRAHQTASYTSYPCTSMRREFLFLVNSLKLRRSAKTPLLVSCDLYLF